MLEVFGSGFRGRLRCFGARLLGFRAGVRGSGVRLRGFEAGVRDFVAKLRGFSAGFHDLALGIWRMPGFEDLSPNEQLVAFDQKMTKL